MMFVTCGRTHIFSDIDVTLVYLTKFNQLFRYIVIAFVIDVQVFVSKVWIPNHHCSRFHALQIFRRGSRTEVLFYGPQENAIFLQGVNYNLTLALINSYFTLVDATCAAFLPR